MVQKLRPEQLRWTCPYDDCIFENTTDVESLPEMIGQDRALRALDFGVGIRSQGFNIYVVGPAGTGRMTAIRKILEREVEGMPAPDDWIYVYNFETPNRPRAVRLSAGQASGFKTDMADLIRDLRTEAPNAFDDENYERQKAAIVEELRRQESDEFARLAQEARGQGLGLQRTP